MENRTKTLYTAFEGPRRIAAGELSEVARKSKEIIDRPDHGPVLIFDDATGETIEVDFRGSAEDVLERIKGTTGEGSAPDDFDRGGPRGPGRPRLGVVGREVTLLPRHWDWLGSQPGGASVALRKLVEEARRQGEGKDRARRSRQVAYRFLSVMAGNLPGFEEATRALFVGDRGRFEELVEPWPADLRDHSRKLASVSFEGIAE
jgi:hypothetical protein